MTHDAAAAVDPLNVHVADQLDEVARLLEEQRANSFRVQAYRNAANTLRELPQGVDEILDAEGLAGLDRLPGIGSALARVIDQIVTTGRLPMLERLRGRSDPIARLASVPGIGLTLARRLHDEHDIETLEDLEVAAYDGTLARAAGFREKRLAAVRDVLATRLGRRSRSWSGRAAEGMGRDEPPVAELLAVDREYREQAQAGTLPRIAPRRFNPSHKRWLPVLHLSRDGRHY
ncbi:MAG TPA: helix-hairpin-helix domain-containing protein, partial [Gemmatimonadaceae bacterium]|nr:helix-hairpin-helix domain-containing protein [Gemmatimonadaceae bacterium]